MNFFEIYSETLTIMKISSKGINYFTATIYGFSISIQKTFITYILCLDFTQSAEKQKRAER